jgi:hypothetical protein
MLITGLPHRSEWASEICGAAVAAVLALLAFNVVLKDEAPLLRRLLSVVIALAVWISAQLYKEFTGEEWDDVARHGGHKEDYPHP